MDGKLISFVGGLLSLWQLFEGFSTGVLKSLGTKGVSGIVRFEDSPIAFTIHMVIYLAAGIFFIWISFKEDT